MGQLSRQLAVLVLIACGVVATAVAGPKPDPERPNWPVIYVLELDGSRMEILEDSIAVEFYDDANRAANVIGNLLVQLDHLQWMIRSTLLGESPTDIPPLEVSAP
jgi:hypothetical protein